MDITSYECRIKLLKLRGELLAAEEDRLHGDVGFTIDEVVRMMQKASKKTVDDSRQDYKWFIR